jgi:hypothetical protein
MQANEGYYVCQNLKLTIRHEPDPHLGGRAEQVRITLTDQEALTWTELLYPVAGGEATPKARRYRVEESIVIAMRRLVTKAAQEGLITFTCPGESMTGTNGPKAPAEAEPLSITLTMPEDAP